MRGVKKFFLLIALFFCACALFHKQILGTAIRYALKNKTDCELAYRSIEWQEGNLVLSDLVLFDPAFHAHIERAILYFDWEAFPKKCKGHVLIERPYVSVLKKRDVPELKEGWFDFTVSILDGTVEWDGPAQFSYDQDQFKVDWGHSGAIFTLSEEGIEGEFLQFRAQLLKPFIPLGEILGGHLTGRVVVDAEHNLTSANVRMDQMAFGMPGGLIESGEGSLSYNADLGGKWELQGIAKALGKRIPFSFTGRGFFKSRWIESEIKFDDSSCKIQGEESWSFEGHHLQAEHLTLLQAGAALYLPELVDWTVLEGTINGQANVSLPNWNAQIEGENLKVCKGDAAFACQKARGQLSQEGGNIVVIGNDYDLKAAGTWQDWDADLRLFSINLELHGGWDGEKFPIQIEKGFFDAFHFKGNGWIDSQLDGSLFLDGEWRHSQGKLPFYCPQISKKGSEWTFDFRFKRAMWDLFRLAGTSNGKEIFFDEKSQMLGAPIHFGHCELDHFDAALKLPWKSFLIAKPILKEWGINLEKVPVLEQTEIHLLYNEGRYQISASSLSPPFQIVAEQVTEGWKVDLASDVSLNCLLQKGGIAKGKGCWKGLSEVEFEGKIQPNFYCELSLPKVHLDLSQIETYKMEGSLDGQGHLIYNGLLESDFDFTASSLKINTHSLENEGSIHLYYSSQKGALLRGLNLHGPFDCVVDVLEYDANHCHWIFHDAQVHLPGSFLTHRFLQFLDKGRDLNFTADLDFASDFSTFVCTMSKGSIPFNGQSYPIENLHLCWENDKRQAAIQNGPPHGKCKAALHYLDHLHRIHLNMGDQISGRLILGEEEIPLTIDWEYGDLLSIQSIEGSFNGLEASFHADSPNSLIGSARVNFTEFSELLPIEVAQGFEEIKMGKGYELKGRLKIEKNLPYFQGILCGKQIEFFGFQFRTLLGQVDLGPKKMSIYDVKISDSAGIFKIDEILLQNENPWTISVPTITLTDLRPSLLQRPGGSIGPISPLVVRQCTLSNLKGLLAEAKTYTAEGQLHFINSYKREESVFDLPANVLSRIVGLDLELLVPVTGDLAFDLSEGYFHLNELTNAYSEGERSQFFLESEPAPTMDLDGNLQIFIKMKQFVLLKITESFLISIEGKLDDPQYHLTKKRFFGLM